MGDNCACNLIKGLWSFFIGSLRMILFLGCLLFVLIQVLWVLSLIVFDMRYGGALPDSEITIRVYFHATSVLMIAILGCYGSFYKHHSSIKAFSILTAVNTGILILVLLYGKNPEYFNDLNAKYSETLQQYEAQYEWYYSKIKNEDSRKATELWDILQATGCCGLKGPQDWDQYRPSNLPSKTYPKSCCQSLKYSFQDDQSKFCSLEEGLAKNGCMDNIKAFELIEVQIHIMFIGLHLILCALACIVGTLNLESCTGRQLPESYARTAADEPANYQRFSGSVYVRQPPVNETFYQQAKKNSVPKPLYPNVRNVEDPDFNAPPPSYGTVL